MPAHVKLHERADENYARYFTIAYRAMNWRDRDGFASNLRAAISVSPTRISDGRPDCAGVKGGLLRYAS